MAANMPTSFAERLFGSTQCFRQEHRMEGQNNTRLIEISYSSLDIDAILASFADDVALRAYPKNG